MIDRSHLESRTLKVKRVTGFLIQILSQKIAEHDFAQAISKSSPRQNLQRIELKRIGVPAVDQRIHVRGQVHQVIDRG